MRHQPHDVPFCIQNPGYVTHGAVTILRIAEYYSVFGLQLVKHSVFGNVTTFSVRDGQPEDLAGSGAMRERRVRRCHAHRNSPAREREFRVPDERARQQARLRQDLKSVTDAEHQAAFLRESSNGLHHRRELCYGAAPEVIAVGKPARQNNRVYRSQRTRIMPNEFSLLAEVLGNCVPCVMVAVTAWKNYDSDSH
jgi:hypothetical protein